jgi:hypothetical protein
MGKRRSEKLPSTEGACEIGKETKLKWMAYNNKVIERSMALQGA